jgi:predicted RNase H-like HicB family nuclease
MQYPAIVTDEGDAALAEFPDCPGCQILVEDDGSIETMAADALEGWLLVSLEHGEVPPRPSHVIEVPRVGRVMWVPVAGTLAAEIALEWWRQNK